MDSVLVKEFEGCEIYLGEIVDNKFNWNTCITYSIGYIVISFVTSYLLIIAFPSSNGLSWIVNYIAAVIVILFAFVGVSCLINLFDDDIPSYYISTLGDTKSKHIPKVSLEVDEIAISKAVREIESDIMELNAKQSKIKMIALRCK